MKTTKNLEVVVVKKDGRREEFDYQKIIDAVSKSAERVMYTLTQEDKETLLQSINQFLYQSNEVEVSKLHLMVEMALTQVNRDVADSYRSYRNYKKTLAEMTDRVWNRTQTILYRGDKENSNADSTLVSTKQSLVRGELAKQFY